MMRDRDPIAGDVAPSTKERARSDESPVRRAEPFLVLIVDDEAQIAQTLAFIVEDAGYTAVVASHGSAALDLARRRPPALVITDLMMPHLNGARLIAALRSEAASAGQAPPAMVLMTAAATRHADESGADALLLKPFDLQEVEDLLHRFLGHPPSGMQNR